VGVLNDFERRLEGAVEGFFARAFRSGLQPVELAKGVHRYVEDYQHVTEDGVVVPNLFRFTLNPKDVQRLTTFGDQLAQELARVVVRTAQERHWQLRGPVLVKLQEDASVAFGTFGLTGRVEVVEGEDAAPEAAAAPAPGPGPAPRPILGDRGRPRVRVVSGGRTQEVELTGARVVAGRMADTGIPLDDATVSRHHAAFVRRGDAWWVVDLDSTNGTLVNGVASAEQQLRAGDRVELGEAVVEFVGA